MTEPATRAPDEPVMPWGAPTAVPPPPRRRRGKTLFAILVVLATVVVIGFYAWFKLGREAASPSELADKFGQAGVTCTQRKALLDLGDTKSLWCATADGKAITVTTWVEDVDYDAWLSTHCAVTRSAPVDRGAAVVSDTWIVDVQRLVRRPPTAQKVAGDLAGVLGGGVRVYDCAQLR